MWISFPFENLGPRDSKAFNVKVGLHQGSVLSPLLFVIVMEMISRELRAGLPIELLCADDLILMAESEESLCDKIVKWKSGLEAKGLKMNAGKTRKCTLWRCKSTPTPKAKLLWMTSHYGPTVVRSVTEIPFHVFI